MVASLPACAGMDFVQVLMQIIGHAAFFARPENAWADLFLAHLPKWLTVQDTDALKGYYSGYSSLQWVESARWVVPALAWTSFAVVLLRIMLTAERSSGSSGWRANASPSQSWCFP